MAEATSVGTYGPRTKYFESLGKYSSIFQTKIHALEGVPYRYYCDQTGLWCPLFLPFSSWPSSPIPV